MPRPCISGRVKEYRDIYVTDEMVALFYQCASPVIQDAIDLPFRPRNDQRRP